MAFLICRSGQRAFALALPHVVETMRPLPFDALPGMPAFVCGVSLIRGELVPVVDAAALFGDGGVTAGRLVLLEMASKRRVALAVEVVVGVRDLAPQALADVPPLLHDAAAELVAAMAVLDGGLLMVLQTARLVPQDAWPLLDLKEALQ